MSVGGGESRAARAARAHEGGFELEDTFESLNGLSPVSNAPNTAREGRRGENTSWTAATPANVDPMQWFSERWGERDKEKERGEEIERDSAGVREERQREQEVSRERELQWSHGELSMRHFSASPLRHSLPEEGEDDEEEGNEEEDSSAHGVYVCIYVCTHIHPRTNIHAHTL